MNNNEIRKLAEEHWKYTKGVIDRIDGRCVELAEYLYIQAFIHGYGHALKDVGMDTLRRGWTKTHIGCDGEIRLVENLEKKSDSEFDYECSKCGEYPKAEQIEWELNGEIVNIDKKTNEKYL